MRRLLPLLVACSVHRLRRWAIGEGRAPRMEPAAPEWVMELRDRYRGG